MPKTKKHPLTELAIEDPDGEAWGEASLEAWAEAERRAEKDGRHPLQHYNGYRDEKKKRDVAGVKPALPEWKKTEAVEIDVLGRFVLEDDGLVHDVTRATKACRLRKLREGASRTFVHFASELTTLPETARPHDVCMGTG